MPVPFYSHEFEFLGFGGAEVHNAFLRAVEISAATRDELLPALNAGVTFWVLRRLVT